MINRQFHADLRRYSNELVGQCRAHRSAAKKKFYDLRVQRHAAVESGDTATYLQARNEAMAYNMDLQRTNSSSTLRHLHLALAFLNNTSAARAEGTWPRNKPISGRLVNWLTPCLPKLTKHQLHEALGLWWAGQRPKDACTTVTTTTVVQGDDPAPNP